MIVYRRWGITNDKNYKIKKKSSKMDATPAGTVYIEFWMSLTKFIILQIYPKNKIHLFNS